MVIIVRARGLRLVIYRDDHEPAHVHVFGDGETKIALGDSLSTMTVLYSVDANRGEERRAERAVKEHHALLLRRWRELHG